MADDQKLGNADHDYLISIARKQIHNDQELYKSLGKVGEESGVDSATLSMILNIPEHEIKHISFGGLDCSIDLVEKYASTAGAKVTYSLSINDGDVLLTTDDFVSIINKVESEVEGTVLDHEEHAFRMGVGMDNFDYMISNPKSMTVGMVRRYVNTTRMLITYMVK